MTEIDMQEFAIDRSRYDDAADIVNEFESPEGLTEELVRQISLDKNEPEWMLRKRLQGLEWFMKTPLPSWGPKEVREKLDLNKIKYYIKSGTQEATKWEDVPEEIRKVAERIGIPEAEKRELGGAGFQFDCLTGDSLVYTNPKGPVEIKNIKPGDTVFSYDEESNSIVKSKVTGFMDKGKLPVFEINVARRKTKS